MGINETSNPISFEAEYGYTGLNGCIKECRTQYLVLEPNSRKILFGFDKGVYDTKNGVFYIKPERQTPEILPSVLRACDFKQLNSPDAHLTIEKFKANGKTANFTIKSDYYAHAVHFNLEDGIRLSDEYFDLLPGEAREIEVYDATSLTSSKMPEARYVKAKVKG